MDSVPSRYFSVLQAVEAKAAEVTTIKQLQIYTIVAEAIKTAITSNLLNSTVLIAKATTKELKTTVVLNAKSIMFLIINKVVTTDADNNNTL